MKNLFVVGAVLLCVLLSGCAGRFGKKVAEEPKETIIVQVTEVETILACLAGNQKMASQEFKAAYKQASARSARVEKLGKLRLICLSLHPRASYKQLKEGMEELSLYIKEHPESAPGLQGIYLLMQRIDREKIVKWAQSSKNIDEKEGLEAENKELLERNETLEANAANDQQRIKELQKQIEQLKNIESIIKNRER